MESVAQDMGMVILSHKSALEYWRYVASPAGVDGSWSGSPYDSAGGMADGLAALSRPLELLVFCDGPRHRSGQMHTHKWIGELPSKAVLKTASSLEVVSPEFCFLQLATQLSLIELIQIGFELCGTYSIRPDLTRGFSTHPSYSCSDSLRVFLGETKKYPGVSRALRAKQFILDGAASPMETIVAMLLYLPYRLGGYGMPRPLLNHRIPIVGAAKDVSSKEYLSCDMYWPKAKVGLEYDSDAYHTGSNRIRRDAQRRNVLGYLGVKTITVTRNQVYSAYEMERVALTVSKALHKRIQHGGLEMTQKTIQLRRELGIGELGS